MSEHATQYTLTPVAQKFILHWGEMGTRWGINRTEAQVHALLFLAPKPLPADEISTTLAVAPTNVGRNLREPEGGGPWGGVHGHGGRRGRHVAGKEGRRSVREAVEARRR